MFVLGLTTQFQWSHSVNNIHSIFTEHAVSIVGMKTHFCNVHYSTCLSSLSPASIQRMNSLILINFKNNLMSEFKSIIFQVFFFHAELLNECPSNIQISPPALMKTWGFPSGTTICKLPLLLLTMVTELQSDSNSSFLWIYANVWRYYKFQDWLCCFLFLTE